MAKTEFTAKNFRPDSLRLILQCEEIINEYLAAGLRLTLRQLYYQLVARALVPNTEQSYKRVGGIISDARYAGYIDWDAIEDRTRRPDLPSEWPTLDALVESALNAFRLPRWEGQDCLVELWVEKDALAGVLAPLGDEFHVTVAVNRGYSSSSAMYESANRLNNRDQEEAIILYVGDMDPSGEDMVRDIFERLETFGCNVTVSKIALTMDQIEEYKPPPNPAKRTDSRYRQFAAKYGSQSWEVDALPPDVLTAIIKHNIGLYLDRNLMEEVIDREKSERRRLREALKKEKG